MVHQDLVLRQEDSVQVQVSVQPHLAQAALEAHLAQHHPAALEVTQDSVHQHHQRQAQFQNLLQVQ